MTCLSQQVSGPSITVRLPVRLSSSQRRQAAAKLRGSTAKRVLQADHTLLMNTDMHCLDCVIMMCVCGQCGVMSPLQPLFIVRCQVLPDVLRPAH